MTENRKHTNCKSLGLLVLRIVLGAVFIYHGITKFQNPGMSEFVGGAAAKLGLTFFSAEIWFNIVKYVEVVGGAMLILGLWSGIATLLLLAVMVVAINTKGWTIGQSELEMVLGGSLIALMLSGAGKYALTSKKYHKAVCCNGNCDCGPDCNCRKDTETVVVPAKNEKAKPEIMEV